MLACHSLDVFLVSKLSMVARKRATNTAGGVRGYTVTFCTAVHHTVRILCHGPQACMQEHRSDL